MLFHSVIDVENKNKLGIEVHNVALKVLGGENETRYWR